MPQWVVTRTASAALLCFVLLVPTIGCGKRVASSAGDATATAKEKKSGPPVETIKPETLATVPDEKTASSTIDTAREPMEAAPPAPSGEMGGGAAVPPAALSAPLAARGVPSPTEDVMNLADIFFDYDQHSIRRDAQSTLSANAAWINSKPGKAIVIEGHCDERGSQAYNLVLGEKRARTVKRYLEDLGVPAARLKTTSYGELRPFCKERDESCYQQNRRAHFVAQ
jgi:peptidoglycan-associated lipoprotein